MGSTFIEYRGRGFEAGDATLEVWLSLLVREIDRLDDLPQWLRETRDEWELQATAGFGFGVMPGLDRYLTDDARRDAVLALSRTALERLESFGETIPCEALNSLGVGGEGAAFTRDVETEVFLRPARYFVKLLEGTLSPSEDDARFAPPPDSSPP